MREALAASVAI